MSAIYINIQKEHCVGVIWELHCSHALSMRLEHIPVDEHHSQYVGDQLHVVYIYMRMYIL